MFYRLANGVSVFAVLLAFALGAAAQAPMHVQASASQPDGKILLAGAARADLGIIVARLNADGTRDASFGGGASWLELSTNAQYSVQVTGLAALADGSIIVLGSIDSQALVARLNSAGSPVSGFGSNGITIDTQSGLRLNAAVQDASGGIVAFGGLGGYAPEAASVRYLADGTRDSTFGPDANGAKVYPLVNGGIESEIRAVAPSAGGFTAVGYIASRYMLLAKLLPNGDLDVSFQGMGWTYWAGSEYSEAFGLGPDAAGGLVAVGTSGNYQGGPSQFFAWFIHPDGSIDTASPAVALPGTSQPISAIARSFVTLPSGSGLLAGTMEGLYDGLTGFGFVRTDASGESLFTSTSPDDGALVAAYAAPNGQFLALGPNEGAYFQSDSVRRLRYFHETRLEFDTDFAAEGNDWSPNPMHFDSVVGAPPTTVRTSLPERVTGIDQVVPVFIDGGTYSIGCTEPYTSDVTMAQNGQWVCIRVVSAATAGAAATATLSMSGVQSSFTVTSAGPPDTSITYAPSNPSGSPVAFQYQGDTSSGPITDLQCQVDGNAWFECPGNGTSFAVDVGSHTFQVRASNAYGTDPTPATYTWNVIAPPNVSITAAPASITNQSSATLSFASSDTTAIFDCALDGFNYLPCGSPVSYTGLADGSHIFRVTARNAAGPGGSTSASWTVDTTAPDTTIFSYPSTPTNLLTGSFQYRSPTGETTFECSLDGGAWYDCSGGSTTVTVAGEGSHSLAVRAYDAAGNRDASPAVKSWTVDLTPPDTSITSGPSGTVATRTITFGFSSTEPGSSFECALSGGVYNGTFYPCPGTSVAFYNLLDGSYAFSVRAVDAAGNRDASPASQVFTVDAPPPDTAINWGPNQFNSNPAQPYNFASFSYASPTDGGATFECSLDGAAYVSCPSGFISYSGLADGLHTFSVRAILGSDVDATPATRTWTVDTVRPDTTVTASPASPTSSTVATLAFSSNEAQTTFNCSLDNSAWVACVSPMTFSSLASGSHSFSVKAIDAAGNQDDSPAYASWTIDPSTLDTSITSGPQGFTALATASFTFTSPDAGAAFECALDSAPFAACVSGVTLSGLSDGPHTFQVRARNGSGGADATPASRSWTVDTTPPETTITGHPYDPTQSSNATFTFASNESGVTFRSSVDGGSPSSTGATLSLFNLSPGAHAISVAAIDAVGNVDPTPATFSWTIDFNYGPETQITSGPTGTVATGSATVTFNSPSGTPAVAFRCAFAGVAFDCSSPWTTSGLADGDYSFSVYAIDAQGNVDRTPASISWTVDTTAPDTAISSAPSGTVATSAAAFQFSSSDPTATFQCSLDGASFSGCGSPASYSGLGDGMHMFEVRARDSAGNVDASPATVTWSIDTTAPNTTVTSGPSAVTSKTGATLTFTATEGAQFNCKLDSGPYGACTSPVSYASLAPGTHTFFVYSVDAVGNVDASPATWSWAIDTSPPDTTITGGPSGNNNPSTASFTFTSTESGSTFQCKLDSGAFAACTSPKAYTGLARGSHTFQVQAIDVAGNLDATPASRTWSVK